MASSINIQQRTRYAMTVFGTFFGIGCTALVLLSLATFTGSTDRAHAALQIVPRETNDADVAVEVVPPKAVFRSDDAVVLKRLVGPRRIERIERPADLELTRPKVDHTDVKSGIAPVDPTDADGDGYVEYYDNGHYVAELKSQKQIGVDASALTLQGTVHEMATIEYVDVKRPHLVVRAKSNDGKHTLVDLGPADRFVDEHVRIGDTITVKARLASLNDQPLLVAEQLRINDEVMTIAR